jgi:hypothetical protein
MANGNPSEEYKDLSDNMRHYANMRFAQLTLYFALTAGLVTALFTVDPPLGDILRFTLKIIGILASAAFGVMEERSTCYWEYFRSRAVDIEKSLGYKQYTGGPATKLSRATKLFRATNAVRAMFLVGVLLWFLALVCRM